MGTNAILGSGDGSSHIWVPADSVSAYMAAPVWSGDFINYYHAEHWLYEVGVDY